MCQRAHILIINMVLFPDILVTNPLGPFYLVKKLKHIVQLKYVDPTIRRLNLIQPHEIVRINILTLIQLKLVNHLQFRLHRPLEQQLIIQHVDALNHQQLIYKQMLYQLFYFFNRFTIIIELLITDDDIVGNELTVDIVVVEIMQFVMIVNRLSFRTKEVCLD